jgi:nucleotide-binding universal stress UspA family protein
MKATTLKPQKAPRGSLRARYGKSAPQISSILAPVDFSEASMKALTYATRLAEQYGAKLTLLYVIEPVVIPDFVTAFPLMMENDQLAATCKSKLIKVARKAGVPAKMIENVVVRHGRPFREITEAARTLKVDLIVISTHGYSGVAHALLGSVAERVVREAPCPVLVVREHEHEFVTV